MRITTLRPGFLVGLKTSVRGNVRYSKREIEADHMDPDGARRAAWETRRTVQAPIEHELAIQARGKARSLITSVCAATNFGLLCAERDQERLTAAVNEARQVVADFNATAFLTRVDVYIIAARVADNDAEAARAINSEIRDLLSTMEEGLRNLDAEAVRAAANKAKGLGKVLSADAASRVQEAIDAARRVARRMGKAGDVAATEIDLKTVEFIRSARTAFLDLDDTTEVAEPEAMGRVVDFTAETTDTVEPVATPRAVDFDVDEPEALAAKPYTPFASGLLFD